MGLHLKFQVCAKADAKAIVSVISQLFQGNQIRFEHVFDNLTFKHMDASRKQIQSLVDFVF